MNTHRTFNSNLLTTLFWLSTLILVGCPGSKATPPPVPPPIPIGSDQGLNDGSNEGYGEDDSVPSTNKQATGQLAPSPYESTDLKLVRVVVGDTIKVQFGDTVESVRLLRIDTPESNEFGFFAASDELKRLLKGAPVRLEFETPGSLERDRYGRILA